jgi:drug/metabolite transporter (DMT)-like permease
LTKLFINPDYAPLFFNATVKPPQTSTGGCEILLRFFSTPLSLHPVLTGLRYCPAGQWFIVSLTSESVSTDDQHHAQLLRADLILLGVTLLAAVSWMFSKEALNEFPPLLFMACRFSAAGLLLAIPGRRALAALQPHEWRASALVGLFFGAAMSFWIMGLFNAHTLGEGAFITSLAVVLVPFISWLLFRERPAKSIWVALPLAIGGLALLSLRHGFNPDPGQLFFFAAALLLSLTFILNGRAAARISALALSAIQLVLVGVVSFTLSAMFEDWPDTFTPTMWLWLILSVTVGTAARFLLQTYAQGLASPSHAAVIMVLEPVWTAIIAAFWFTERMETAQILGCTLILLALLANRWSALRRWLKR